MTDGSPALTILRAVISLGLVLALLVFAMRILARRGGVTPLPRTRRVMPEVLGRRALGRRSSLQVVQVADQVLVLGVTDDHISVLTHLSPEVIGADEETNGGGAAEAVAATDLVAVLRRQGGAASRLTGLGARRGGRHRGGSRV